MRFKYLHYKSIYGLLSMYIILLPLQILFIPFHHTRIIPADLAFLILSIIALPKILTNKINYHRAYLYLGFYILFVFFSIIFNNTHYQDILISTIKIGYIALIPFIVDHLIQDREAFFNILNLWNIVYAVLLLLCMVSLGLFIIGLRDPWINLPLHGYGSLPPGPYPRLDGLFLNHNAFFNYTIMSLALLFLAFALGRLQRWQFIPLHLAGILISFLSLSPGFGGIGFLESRYPLLRPRIKAWMKMSAWVLAFAFLWMSLFTFPTLLKGPSRWEPSPRLLTWKAASAVILSHPIFGIGLDQRIFAVHWVNPSGRQEVLTNAHNVYLSIAFQCGIPALIAFVLLWGTLWWDVKKYGPLSLILATAIGVGIFYHGLTNSLEDNRHLWVLMGLVLAFIRLFKEKKLTCAAS